MLFEFGYNMSHGGDAIKREGWKHTAESKDKIRNSLLGVKHTEERRKNISEVHKGKSFFANNFGTQIHLSQEQKEKIIKMHVEDLMISSEIAKQFPFGQQFIRMFLQKEGKYISYNKIKKLRINESKVYIRIF